jgi:tetratricopeptide (TPR) repeat protein
MPALAATPADRDECAASADKPDVEACSRIIDDANESVVERVEAFKNRGRGSFNRKDYDRGIADYGDAIKLSPKDAWAFAHRCEAYESKDDHDAAIVDCTEAIKIDPKYGWACNNRGVACYGLYDYDAALADHAEAIKADSRDPWAYARRSMAWTEKGVDGESARRATMVPGHYAANVTAFLLIGTPRRPCRRSEGRGGTYFASGQDMHSFPKLRIRRKSSLFPSEHILTSEQSTALSSIAGYGLCRWGRAIGSGRQGPS